MTVRTFDEVAAERLPGLLRYATVLTGDPDQADDIVQEVLTKAFEKWSRISETDNPEAYLTRMVTNQFLTVRRKWSSRFFSATPEQLDHHIEQSNPADSIDDRAELHSLLRRLPPRQRAALVLRHYLGYPDNEAAEILGCAESTVRSLCSRGLAALQLHRDDREPDALSSAHPRKAES